MEEIVIGDDTAIKFSGCKAGRFHHQLIHKAPNMRGGRLQSPQPNAASDALSSLSVGVYVLWISFFMPAAPTVGTTHHCLQAQGLRLKSFGFKVWGFCFPGGACTVVLRGSSEQGLDEAERSLHDALAILSQLVLQQQQQKKQQQQAATAAAGTVTATSGLKEGLLSTQEQQLLLVCGAGAAEMAMEAAVSDLAKKTPGKEVHQA